jgi:hypothetical protein
MTDDALLDVLVENLAEEDEVRYADTRDGAVIVVVDPVFSSNPLAWLATLGASVEILALGDQAATLRIILP